MKEPTLPDNKLKWVLPMNWGWYEYYPGMGIVSQCVNGKGSTILHGYEAENIKQLVLSKGQPN